MYFRSAGPIIYPLFVQKAKALIPHTDYGESQLIAMSNGEHVSDQSPILFTSMGSFLQ